MTGDLTEGCRARRIRDEDPDLVMFSGGSRIYSISHRVGYMLVVPGGPSSALCKGIGLSLQVWTVPP